MRRYFLGADIGATKSHALVCDESGDVLGCGRAGPGNHEIVGYEGLRTVLDAITREALGSAGLDRMDIAAAGYGVGGYDWPSERGPTLEAIDSLGFRCPREAVNDALLGVLAGASRGWGVAVVAGTGCSCWGWDSSHARIGHVTGNGRMFGEYGGASDLAWKACSAVAAQYTLRGPPTALTGYLLRAVGASSAEELLDGISQGRLRIGAEHAPLVFAAAEAGDAEAEACIRWAAGGLASLACGVIRQLGIEHLEFDVVLVGGLYNGGERLIGPMRNEVRRSAPRANLVRLPARPVSGAVLLAMQLAGAGGAAARARVLQGTRAHLA